MPDDERVDYRDICTHDDEDVDAEPSCWKCKCFVFPIGCMKDEEIIDTIQGVV